MSDKVLWERRTRGQNNLTTRLHCRRTCTVQSYLQRGPNMHTIKCMFPWTYPSPHTKRHLDRFSRFMQSSRLW